tara:strand:- start:895 stop:1368 length:474 start_codon:yes stop_codon:yes gene_type:complete
MSHDVTFKAQPLDRPTVKSSSPSARSSKPGRPEIFSDAEKKIMLDAYRDGLAGAQIAALLHGQTARQVSNWIHRAHKKGLLDAVPMPPKKRKHGGVRTLAAGRGAQARKAAREKKAAQQVAMRECEYFENGVKVVRFKCGYAEGATPQASVKVKVHK